MTNFYRRKPDAVHAMFWDGTKEGYLKIQKWVEFYKFLQEEISIWCDYWDEHDAPPEDYDSSGSVYTNAQLYDYTYRQIHFEAWGDDVEVDPNSWIVFRGSERDSTDEFPTPRGKIMSDEAFRDTYEPIYGGYGDDPVAEQS